MDLPSQAATIAVAEPPIGQVILITGCSSGIGLATAQLLRQRGWRVFATARQAADVIRLQEDGFDALYLDVTDVSSMETALAVLLTRTQGRIDALFNNAGYGQPGAVEDVPVAALREQFETNLFGSAGRLFRPADSPATLRPGAITALRAP